MLRVVCPACRSSLDFHDTLAGQKVACPCGQKMMLQAPLNAGNKTVLIVPQPETPYATVAPQETRRASDGASLTGVVLGGIALGFAALSFVTCVPLVYVALPLAIGGLVVSLCSKSEQAVLAVVLNFVALTLSVVGVVYLIQKVKELNDVWPHS